MPHSTSAIRLRHRLAQPLRPSSGTRSGRCRRCRRDAQLGIAGRIRIIDRLTCGARRRVPLQVFPAHDRSRPPRLPWFRTAAAARIRRTRLPRLLHVRGAGPRPAVPRRRPETGTAAHHLRHERAGPECRGQAEEVRAYRRRRDRQVPPAWRQRLLRGAGADGAAVLLPLPADRRPGQLRLHRRPEVVRGDALHRIQADPDRRGAARRTRPGHGGLVAELRRHHGRADLDAGAAAAPAAQRHHRHRRGHGHRRAAAQPQRDRQRADPPARRSRRQRRRPVRTRARPGLPDQRRDHHSRRRPARDLRNRPRQRARARHVPEGTRQHRDHRAALPGVAVEGDRADRAADARQEAAVAGRHPRRIRPRQSGAGGAGAALQPGRRRATDGPPVRDHRPGAQLPGQPQRDRPGRPPAGQEPQDPARGMAALPQRHRGAPAQPSAGEGRAPPAPVGRPAGRVPQPGRSDPHHPQRGRAEAGADRALRAQRGTGRLHPGNPPAPAGASGRNEDPRRAGRAGQGARPAAGGTGQQDQAEEDDQRRAGRRRQEIRRRAALAAGAAWRGAGDRRDRTGAERADDHRDVGEGLDPRGQGPRRGPGRPVLPRRRQLIGRGARAQHAAGGVPGFGRPRLLHPGAFAALGARQRRAADRAFLSRIRRLISGHGQRRERQPAGAGVLARLRLRHPLREPDQPQQGRQGDAQPDPERQGAAAGLGRQRTDRPHRRGDQRRPPAGVPDRRPARAGQGQGQQDHRHPQGQARHRAGGGDRRGRAGQYAAGEERAAHHVAVVQGPGRLPRRARQPRRIAAARVAEGG